MNKSAAYESTNSTRGIEFKESEISLILKVMAILLVGLSTSIEDMATKCTTCSIIRPEQRTTNAQFLPITFLGRERERLGKDLFDFQVSRVHGGIHAQANGGRGRTRAVRTAKEILKKNTNPYLAFLSYRSTPLQNGLSL
ncbi:hypothetical protein QZH41_018474 [Actinostola sp. cb2023]|nr:hypothetical protein QZH41_018474 [Actinostola sp. cb2023]